MARKVIFYSFAAIGGYLAVRYYTGFVKDEHAVSSGGIGLIKAFQGR